MKMANKTVEATAETLLVSFRFLVAVPHLRRSAKKLKPMNYYVFSCKLRLREANPYKDELLGGYSHTWVQAESLEAARIRVADFFADSQWVIANIEHELEGDLAHHPWNHRDTQPGGELGGGLHQSWLQLHKFGIGSEIHAFREEVKK